MLEKGKVYRLWKSSDDYFVLEIHSESSSYWWVNVLEKGETNTTGTPAGERGMLNKEGRIMREYQVNCIAASIDNYQFENDVPTTHTTSTTTVKKRRRTPQEVAMDVFTDKLLLIGKIERLRAEIDKALESGDKDIFMSLSKEYTKLSKKVTA